MLDQIINLEKKSEGFLVKTLMGQEFLAEAILLASGTEHRHLGLDNEDKFVGRGLSYCATCDAMFYKNKTVAVVGGGNSAHTASLYLADIADKVYQIHRKSEMRGEQAWVEKLEKNEKVEIIYSHKIVELKGDSRLEKIILKSEDGQEKELDVDGLFVEIGTSPKKDFSQMLSLEVDKSGYIKVDNQQKTSLDGIWAAGDITTNSNGFRQIITACSEGAIATENIFSFFQQKK